MNFGQFRDGLTRSEPPEGVGALLTALWFEARGDWQRAHAITQDESGPNACWVHAYLHRKEGDPSNAAYWYRRAERKVCSESLEREWADIVTELLASD